MRATYPDTSLDLFATASCFLQEAETFGFSRVVVPFTRKNRSASRKRGRSAKAEEPASTEATASGGGRGRGSIEVVECR